MPDEIQPALTPDEWATVAHERQHPELTAQDTSKPLTGIAISYEDGWFPTGDLYNPFTPHQLIALINAALPDDDPRKITHAKIEKLRELVEYAAGAYTFQAEAEAVGREATEAERFLDALAALLPPHE